MSKERAASSVSLFQEFFQGRLYKRSQGKVARQVTFAVLAIAVVLGSWRLKDFLSAFVEGSSPALVFGVPGAILVVGLWISYRVVNITKFADFLIAVEAEMNKVTWPTRVELFRSSMVVIIVIFFLAGMLFLFDLIWKWLFTFIGILN
ncbi:MAG: preprotein translocase subunit SecE [Pirellulales bacterium]|nr:preprotein translocase subunit SecE [Pirellulales bacterium]